jgi:tripeptide aminopeptidase
MERPNAWKNYNDADKKAVFQFAEAYREFLSKCKTERECVTELKKKAMDAGFIDMKEIIENHMYIIDRAKKAMADAGIAPNIVPIRGGTDGARLSFRGLPCPNLSTGGENFHSRFEFVSVESMEKITDLLLQIIKNSVTEGIAK